MAFDYVDKCLYGAPRPKSSYVASGQNHSTSGPLSVVSLWYTLLYFSSVRQLVMALLTAENSSITVQ